LLDFYVRFQLFRDMFHIQLLYHSFFGSFMLYVNILNEYFTLAAKHGVEDVYSFEALKVALSTINLTLKLTVVKLNVVASSCHLDIS
jgi:hypothetical protein